MSLEIFARFWRARDQRSWSVQTVANPHDLTLEVNAREAINTCGEPAPK
jgi:hypothetical protein